MKKLYGILLGQVQEASSDQLESDSFTTKHNSELFKAKEQMN